MIPGILGADVAIGLGCGDLGISARDVIHLRLQCTNGIPRWPGDFACRSTRRVALSHFVVWEYKFSSLL